jgi:hypothetical protein
MVRERGKGVQPLFILMVREAKVVQPLFILMVRDAKLYNTRYELILA